MKDLEKQIEEAAKTVRYAVIPEMKDNIDQRLANTIELSFVLGAKSSAAKEFHQQGMYTEEEVLNLVDNLVDEINKVNDQTVFDELDILVWFNQNKK